MHRIDCDELSVKCKVIEVVATSGTGIKRSEKILGETQNGTEKEKKEKNLKFVLLTQ